MTLHYFLRWLALILIGLLIYIQTFHYAFVFDDYNFIVSNLYIKDFSRIHLIWHFFPMTRLVGMYTFAINFLFNQLHPWGYHLFNFIVHILSTGLVWLLAGLLFKITKPQALDDQLSKDLPFIIALFFLVHPCQTQAISYISQRFESMATMFYLGAVCCYLSARLATDQMHKMRLWGGFGLLTVLGIFTKEVVITVPLMIIALEWILFPFRDKRRTVIFISIGGILLGVLFTQILHAGLKSLFSSFPSESHDGDMLTPTHYVLTQMRVFLTLLRLLIWPIRQNLDYDYPSSGGILNPPLTMMGLLVIASFVLSIIKLRRNYPLVAVGLSWILITFSINLAPRVNVIFEHKLYLISFGFFLTLVVGLSGCIQNRRALMWIFACMIAALVLVSYQRNKVWANEVTIWQDCIKNSPYKARVNANLGTALAVQGKYNQSIFYLTRAININPKYEQAYNNRGNTFTKQGDFMSALSDYNKTIELNPKNADAYDNRAIVYYHQEKYLQAIADLNHSLEINPVLLAALYNRSTVYYRLGQKPQAIADLNKAIEIDPNQEEGYYNRGIIYAEGGSFSLAMTDLNKAISIDPSDPKGFYSRGSVYALMGNLSQAIIDFNKTIELDAGYVKAYINRGNAYAKSKAFKSAILDYNKAISLDPSNKAVLYNRAVVFDQLKAHDK